MQDIREYYRSQLARYRAALERAERQLSLLSWYRLLAFLTALFAWYRYLQNREPAWLLLGISSGIGFFLFLRSYFRWRDQRSLRRNLVWVTENEQAVLDGALNRYEDGSNWKQPSVFAEDLDVFGPGSLFQLLNRCSTLHGKKRLASLLAKPLSQPAEMVRRQDAIRQLSSQTDRRLLLAAQAMGQEEKDSNLDELEPWLATPAILSGKGWFTGVRWLVPAANLYAAYYYLSTDRLFLLLITAGISWIITAFFAREINRQHQLLGRKHSILAQYAGILKAFREMDKGGSSLLEELNREAAGAYEAMRSLGRLGNWFDQRLNMLVNVFLNSFFLYDLQCLRELERWRKKHSESFLSWVNCVGEIESLASLASFAFNHPDFIYGQLAPEGLLLEAEGLGHPLIPASERILNDLTLGREKTILLITGSNMSGKTTFLRTVGVNLLLAQCGAPVCASKFTFTPLRILSSIRIQDSLQEHTSYFMAELKKLQEMIGVLQSGTPALLLIDEILRGTNSDDKTHGSEMFIRQLLRYPCLALFATHDLVLSKLEEEFPAQVGNACFESELSDDQLHFDYRLRPGVARNRNASFLMKQRGIIDS